ncbi:hypothetical protein N9L92_00520 [Saprospiraceae bacterium]|nr:hypothetical protein [Saprospiraceae bacterium]
MKTLNIIGIVLLVTFISCQDNSDGAFSNFNFPKDCCNQEFDLVSIDTVLSCDNSVIMDTLIPIPIDSFLVSSFYVPCVFSPDSDQIINRAYSIFTSGPEIDVCDVKIFDQDGIIVFENDNFIIGSSSNGWDGIIDNEVVEGPFEIVYKFNVVGRSMELRGIVCSLLCSRHSEDSYFDQDLDQDVLRWPSQHDGEGNFSSLLPSDECIN